jgi:hypothetical protein
MNEITVQPTLADLAEAIASGGFREDFVIRVRVQYATDEAALEWLTTPNAFLQLDTPWEFYYGAPQRQGHYLDGTCEVFVKGLNKRGPGELRHLSSED